MRTLTKSQKEILNKEFLDIADKKVSEFDISTVRGSVRIRTARFITPEETAKRKQRIKSLKFPSKK
ncbi:MAG: hypothetical protein ACOCWG_01595 [bacterium]